MKLNKRKILNTANAIKNGIVSEDKLTDLIGGQRLYDIFDDYTVNAIIKNIINLGKFHNMIKDEDGLDMLEGLLNNTISGNLQDFYMIKSDYILQLPKEQQINMANSISGGKQDLSMALQNLWSKGIRTEACTTRSSDNTPMIQVRIKDTEFIQQDLIQQIYNQGEFSYDGDYNYIDGDFMVRISGDNLYECINGLKNDSSKTNKRNIFEGMISTDLYLARHPEDNIHNLSELKRKVLIEERTLANIKGHLQQLTERDNKQGKQHKNSTNLPVKQGRVSKFFSKIRAIFARKPTIREVPQQNNDTVEIKKKPWELEPMNKLNVQRNIAKIVKEHTRRKRIKPQKNYEKGLNYEQK